MKRNGNFILKDFSSSDLLVKEILDTLIINNVCSPYGFLIETGNWLRKPLSVVSLFQGLICIFYTEKNRGKPLNQQIKATLSIW